MLQSSHVVIMLQIRITFPIRINCNSSSGIAMHLSDNRECHCDQFSPAGAQTTYPLVFLLCIEIPYHIPAPFCILVRFRSQWFSHFPMRDGVNWIFDRRYDRKSLEFWTLEVFEFLVVKYDTKTIVYVHVRKNTNSHYCIKLFRML